MSGKDRLTLQQLVKIEEVVRTELERRSEKKRVAICDEMLEEIDQQLIFVAQFKKEWIRQQQMLESHRLNVVAEESTVRHQLEQVELEGWSVLHDEFKKELCY